MEEDLILVDTDPGYDTALLAIDELENQARLETINRQASWLHVIQSDVGGGGDDDDDDDIIFKFGGQTRKEQASAFGETASAVFRMVMLNAAKIEEDDWLELGPIGKKRNKAAMKFKIKGDLPPFKLLDGIDNETVIEEYMRKFRQLFPPDLIAKKVFENQGKNVPFTTTMLIFRENFKEVIIISAHANATMHPLGWKPGEFDCHVRVTCTRKRIKEGIDGEYFTKLKKLFSGAGRQAQPIARKRSEVLDQLKKDKKSKKDKSK